MSLSALGAIAGAQLATNAFGSILGSATNARNADVNQATNIATAPLSNSVSRNVGVATTNSVSNASSYSSGWSEGYTAGKEASQWAYKMAQEANEAEILRAREANETQMKMLQAQMDYNSAEAKLAREWQENLSNTAYQRAVQDLQKAGLNPVLAVGNLGASTPTGAYASSGLAIANKANTYMANTYPDSYSRSANSGGSTQSSKTVGGEVNIGGSKSNTGPAYIKASGSVAEALANNLNVSSATALKNNEYPTEEELIKSAWGEG